MGNFTNDELRLACRLVGTHGYDFDHAAAVMGRHGYPGHNARSVQKLIRENSPGTWANLSDAWDRRRQSQFHGVAAPAPPRRYQVLPDAFIEFVSQCKPDASEEEMCWAARLSGFDCNITDVKLAAKRILRQTFRMSIDAPMPIHKASDAGKCLWPAEDIVDESGEKTYVVCAADRERGSYCGPHYCRSLG